MEDSFESIQDHIVILGWSHSVPRIIRELRDEVHRSANDLYPILIVTPEREHTLEHHFERVYFIYGKVNDPSVLARANLSRAHAVLIPTTIRETNISDGEGVFCLLSTLAVEPNARVCLQVANSDNGKTLEHIRHSNFKSGDVEIISFESVAERLLAQSAINPGVTRVYDHLLSFSEDTNEIYVCDVAPRWHGKSFRELSRACFDAEVILIGFEKNGAQELNPKNRDHVFEPGERAWYISFNKAAGLKVIAN